METKLSVRSALAFTTVALFLIGTYRWVKKTHTQFKTLTLDKLGRTIDD
jgi:hypothetical protein